MSKKKVIVAGHICLDITPVFPENKVSHIGDILQPGKLIQMGSADVYTGGAVANTGLGMKILGADVSLMGKIGTDDFGDMVLGVLEKHGAANGMIRDENETTSYSVVLAIPGVDRIFLHHPGRMIHLLHLIFQRKCWPKQHCFILDTRLLWRKCMKQTVQN